MNGEMTMNLSPCGIDCDACALKENCAGGCQVNCGKPFYIKDFGVECCPIFSCSVSTKGHRTCGECPDVPCQIFFDWKDPSMSDEDHREAVKANVALLKSLQ